MSNLVDLPLFQIRENPAALRNVDREDPEFLELVDSVRQYGVLKPILVTPATDEKTGEFVYEGGHQIYGLVDGLQRYTASQDAGQKFIPVNIVSVDKANALVLQLIANAIGVETKPAEYADALYRILNTNPTMSMAELARKLNKSPQWLNERLGLLKLAKPIQKLVDENKVGLSNAYALAKLKDHEEQMAFLDRAQTESPASFIPVVAQRVKEIQDAKRKGRKPAPAEFVPTAHLQKLGDIKNEYDKHQVAAYLFNQLAQNKHPDWKEGFNMAISWVLHLDPISIKILKDEDDKRRASNKLKSEQRQKERADKRKQEADARVAKAQDELESKQLVEV